MKYVCDVCGYTFEGDLPAQPDDFVCPVCGADKGHFEKQDS
jgi:Rubrerythrin